ncbi:hypothetical protein [Lacipirellula limnantheis]|uniref:Uncharacterized protein n=1 Tax=Lacipirellula limnantheis TaxID=2528024 RepID=A0A517TVB3_9BACT|nr:hypothetical protein [Lacipirellula limnantheis]QDT72315.1 hypothetical protein I41_14870 [Lacipirellula limnantheis]
MNESASAPAGASLPTRFAVRRPLAGLMTLALLAFSATAAQAALVYNVGQTEVIYSASQRRNKGLDYWVDGNLGVVPIGNGQYQFYGANGPTPVRTTGTLADPAQSRSNVSITGLPSNYFNYVAGGPTYFDATTGARLMIYHAERHASSGQDYYSVLGMAVSTDSQGLQFRDLGLIVEPDVPMSQRTQSIEVGGGSFAVMNGDMYVYYRDYLEGGGSSELAVAKAPIATILANAINNQGTSFTKYYNGAWTQPGIGGRSSALEVGNPGNAWSAVSYNDYLGGLIMMTSDWADSTGNNNLFLSTSMDGVNWSQRQAVVTDAGEQMYPTLIGTGADPTHTGQSFYAYYTDSASGGWNRWNDAKLVRRQITLSNGVPTPAPDPEPTPTSGVIASYRSDFQAGAPAQGWKYMWNPNGKLGDASKYAALQWSSTEGVYNTTGAATRVWNGKSHNDDYLMLGADGGHPGRPGYYAITGYTIQADDGAGLYQLIGSSIMKSDSVKTGDEDGLDLLLYINNTKLGSLQSVSTTGSMLSFDRDLGRLAVGDTVYVMIGAGKNQNFDLFKSFDFSLIRTPQVTIPDPNPNPAPTPEQPVERQWIAVAGFRGDFQSGGPAAGWKYQWSASGKLGDASKYANLKWSSVAGAYNTTGGATTVWNGKTHNDDYLTLGLDGGHPGRAGYCTIAGYTIQAEDGAGSYRLNAGLISKADGVKTGDEDGLELLVYVNSTRIGGIETVLTDGSWKGFFREFGQLAVGDTIYVMIGSLKNQNFDNFANFDFSIERLTAVTPVPAAAAFALASVPEPSSAVMLTLATAMLSGARLRQRLRS